jgi:hypothetical protein
MLRSAGWDSCAQNIDSKDFIGKILRNKELAWLSRRLGALPELLRLGAIARMGAVCVSARSQVKVVRHMNSISFWMAVENLKLLTTKGTKVHEGDCPLHHRGHRGSRGTTHRHKKAGPLARYSHTLRTGYSG